MQINKLNVINAYMMHLYGGGGSHTTTVVRSCARVQHYIINAYDGCMLTRMQSKGKIIAYIYIYTVNCRAQANNILYEWTKSHTHNTWRIIHSSNTQTTRFSVLGRVAKKFQVGTILVYSIQFGYNDYLGMRHFIGSYDNSFCLYKAK